MKVNLGRVGVCLLLLHAFSCAKAAKNTARRGNAGERAEQPDGGALSRAQEAGAPSNRGVPSSTDGGADSMLAAAAEGVGGDKPTVPRTSGDKPPRGNSSSDGGTGATEPPMTEPAEPAQPLPTLAPAPSPAEVDAAASAPVASGGDPAVPIDGTPPTATPPDAGCTPADNPPSPAEEPPSPAEDSWPPLTTGELPTDVCVEGELAADAGAPPSCSFSEPGDHQSCNQVGDCWKCSCTNSGRQTGALLRGLGVEEACPAIRRVCDEPLEPQDELCRLEYDYDEAGCRRRLHCVGTIDLGDGVSAYQDHTSRTLASCTDETDGVEDGAGQLSCGADGARCGDLLLDDASTADACDRVYEHCSSGAEFSATGDETCEEVERWFSDLVCEKRLACTQPAQLADGLSVVVGSEQSIRCQRQNGVWSCNCRGRDFEIEEAPPGVNDCDAALDWCYSDSPPWENSCQ